MCFSNIAGPLMKFKAGRGDSNFLWFDNCHIDGPLYQKHEHRVAMILVAS